MNKRIVVLFHERQRELEHSGYAVTGFYPYWRADGHEVVEAFGTATRTDGDLLFLHVDLSEVPEPYLELAASYPAQVNGRVRDIRKTAYCDHLLTREDAWQGPVIVKSNRNFGGIPEAVLGIQRLDGRGLTPPFRDPMEYAVFHSLEEVPEAAFTSADLVVQRFLPEMADGLFHIRSYFFLGDHWVCNLIGSRNPIVKEESRETLQRVQVHPAIEAWRRRLGLDFGKLDYVVRDGEAILLDVNKTIGGGRFQGRHGGSSRREARARGLYALW